MTDVATPALYYTTLAFWADLASFAGLTAGCLALWLTFLTWRKAGSIQQQLAISHNKHLFAVRANSYIKQLRKVSKEIADLMKCDGGEFLPRFTQVLSECKEICRSVRNKVDINTNATRRDYVWHFVSLTELDDYIDRVNELLSSCPENDFRQELQSFLGLVARFQHEIDQIEKDRKESI